MAKWRRLADYFLVVGYQQDKDGTINGYVICTDRLIVSLSVTHSVTDCHSLTHCQCQSSVTVNYRSHFRRVSERDCDCECPQ